MRAAARAAPSSSSSRTVAVPVLEVQSQILHRLAGQLAPDSGVDLLVEGRAESGDVGGAPRVGGLGVQQGGSLRAPPGRRLLVDGIRGHIHGMDGLARARITGVASGE